MINCGPIDQIVRIDELPEKAGPIDQLRQLINGAQQRSLDKTTTSGNAQGKDGGDSDSHGSHRPSDLNLNVKPGANSDSSSDSNSVGDSELDGYNFKSGTAATTVSGPHQIGEKPTQDTIFEPLYEEGYGEELYQDAETIVTEYQDNIGERRVLLTY